MSKQRGYVFTYNNYPVTHKKIMKERFEKGNMEYMIYGEELAPTTGTPHLQGYLYTKNPVAFMSIVDLMKGCNIIKAKGTANDNEKYCSKDANVTTFGIKPIQGKRSDIDKVRDQLKNGDRMKQIVQTATSLQSIRLAEYWLKYNEPERDWEPEVIWIWGETESGKTKKAFELAPGAWISSRNLKWWEGYDGHENVIIDDFRGDFCTFHELLRILDRYPYRVEVKGSSRQLLAKKIIITSCYHPKKVYDTREDLGQLLRRIKKVIHMKKSGTEV